MQNRQHLIISVVVLAITLIAVYFAFVKNTQAPHSPAIPESQTVQESTQVADISKDCDGQPTPTQTEGPYYKSGSPQKNVIAQGVQGEKLVVRGYVFDRNCKPVAGAWLDFWQADSNGRYDNTGYTLRGHLFTDSDGMYKMETIIPSAYEMRPPHIHVKVKAPNGPILTTQLYFPNEQLNRQDSIFNEDLIMKVEKAGTDTLAAFNFELP